MREKDILAYSVLSGTALGLLLALATPTRMITRTVDDWRSHIPRHPDPDAWLRRNMARQGGAFDYSSEKYDIALPSQSYPGANYWANYYADADRAQREAEAANRDAGGKVEYPAPAADEVAGPASTHPQAEPTWEVAPDPAPAEAFDADGASEADGPVIEVQ